MGRLESSLQSTAMKKQSGASFFGTIMLLVVIGMTLLFALKVAPSYLDNNVVTNAMDGMANNNLSQMTLAEVRNSLRRSLQTNNIDNIDLSNMQIIRENGVEYIEINYERRVDLFYNIDAVVVFENRFERN